jgi:NADH:ubiquinone oxidoreductase subunit F (NADH-binding)
VLDGAFRAAGAISATKLFVYLSDALAAASVTEALEEFGETPIPVEIVRVAPSYVGGEETAAVRAVNGGPALPTDKPPRPFEAGVDGQPTLVANVETLANLPSIDAMGAEAYLDSSIDRASPGTFLLTLSGACRNPGLYEVPLGSIVDDVIEATGGFDGEPRGALMGGFFGGVIGPRFRTLPLSYPVLRAEGTGLGCGAIRVLGEDDCAVQVADEVMEFFEANNARQCGPCIRGTLAMSTVLNHLTSGTASEEELEKLKGWSSSLRHRGACAHLDGAANLAATLFLEFPTEVNEHGSFPCHTCRSEREEPSRLTFSLENSTN